MWRYVGYVLALCVGYVTLLAMTLCVGYCGYVLALCDGYVAMCWRYWLNGYWL